MKDLGKKRTDVMYPTMANQENKIDYPSMDLPLSVIEGLNLKLDDEVEVRLVGKISGLQDTKWIKCVSIEAKEGEVLKKAKEENK